MVRTRIEGVLIAGGGLSGALAALALAHARPDLPLLLVEESGQFGGRRHHWLFEEELDATQRALVGPIVEHRWPGFYTAFPGRSRNLKADLIGFSGASVHRALLDHLPPDQLRLDTRVVAVKADGLDLEGGEVIKAPAVIDARGATNLSLLEMLHEARVERQVRLQAPHRLDRPLLMDATIDQSAGYAFIQAFPLDAHRLRVGLVSVSERMLIEESGTQRLDHYLADRGWAVAETEEEQAGVLPLAYGGDPASFWRLGGARVAKIGVRGGFIQPATGRTAPDALRIAALIAGQRRFTTDSLHHLIEEQAQALWRKREMDRGLVAALAADRPEARRARFERLYQLERGPLVNFLVGSNGLIERRLVQRTIRG